MKSDKSEDKGSKKEDADMAVMAKPVNKSAILQVNSIEEFVKSFNATKSSKDFKKEREVTREIFLKKKG